MAFTPITDADLDAKIKIARKSDTNLDAINIVKLLRQLYNVIGEIQYNMTYGTMGTSAPMTAPNIDILQILTTP